VQEEKVRVLSSHTPLLASIIHTRTGTYLLEVLSPKYYFSQVRSLASFFLLLPSSVLTNLLTLPLRTTDNTDQSQRPPRGRGRRRQNIVPGVQVPWYVLCCFQLSWPLFFP